MELTTVTRVEKHIVKKTEHLHDLLFKSKNLYNYVTHILRQHYFAEKIRFKEHKEAGGRYEDFEWLPMPQEYDLAKQFRAENQPDFRDLPSDTSGMIMGVIFKSWKGYWASLKVFNKKLKGKTPTKEAFKGQPKVPNYKDKTKGEFALFFSGKNQVRYKQGYLHFPAKVNIEPLKTGIKAGSKINQVRIIPRATHYVFEVVYQRETKLADLNKDAYMGIDLGLSNLAMCVTNINTPVFFINGKPLKGMNAFFNKKRAMLMSYVGDRGTSKNLLKLTHKRNMKIDDYMHKASRYVINYCIEHKIGNIVVGLNKEWKQEINIGKRNNQNFVSIPHTGFIEQLIYKGEEVGIKVKTREESYTSKCSAIDKEPIKKHETYKGSRVKRGLFKTSTGKLINADLNGALNILRKEIGDEFIPANTGFGCNPLKITV